MLSLVSHPYEEQSLKISYVPQYSNVSVNIAMYMLFYNIVSDTIHSIIVCVDFLDTHMTSLVFFGNLGMIVG